jgi:hypothetical protein
MSSHSDEVLRTARHLWRQGLAVHWLRPRSKAPILDKWQRGPRLSLDQLVASYRPGFNLGLRTGRVDGASVALVAVDLDNLERVEWAQANLKPTLARSYTAKGEHHLYLHPGPHFTIRNEVKIAGFDIDLRGDFGNLVIPPSIHPRGEMYLGLVPWDQVDFAKVPIFDRRWLPSRPIPAPAPVEAARALSPNLEFLVRRGRKLAQTWQVNERGNGQGTDTFRLAGRLIHGLTIPREEALRILREDYNPRCPEPYTEELLARKVDQAATQIRDRSPAYLVR